MSDPFYVPILHAAESRIAAADRRAQEQNLPLTDSQVRSILNKVRKSAEGHTPQVPSGSGREVILAGLHAELVGLRSTFQVESEDGEVEELSLSEWVLVMRTIEDSIRLRSDGPGSRAYLDYILRFLSGEGNP